MVDNNIPQDDQEKMLDDLIANPPIDQTPAPTAVTPSPPPVPAAPTRVNAADIYKTYLQLKGAQDQAKNNMLNANLLAAGSKIAEGLGTHYGAKIGDNADAVKMLQGQANAPVEDLQNKISLADKTMQVQNEAEMDDPNSDISKLYRIYGVNALKKMNPELYDKYKDNLTNMSATQLTKLLPGLKSLIGTPHAFSKEERFIVNGHPAHFDPNLGKYVDSVTGKVVDEKDVLENAVPRVNPVTGELGRVPLTSNNVQPLTNAALVSPEQPKETFQPNVRQAAALDKSSKEFDEKVKQPLQVVSDADTLIRELGSNNKLQIPAVKDRIAKIATGQGALTDYSQQSFSGSQAALDRVMQWLDKQTSSVWTPDNKQQFMDLMKQYVTKANIDYNKATQVHSDRLRMGYGIPNDYSQRYLSEITKPPALQKELEKDTVKQQSTMAPRPTIKVRTSPGAPEQTIYQDNLDEAKKLAPNLEVVK